jgi:hypothetical protein
VGKASRNRRRAAAVRARKTRSGSPFWYVATAIIVIVGVIFVVIARGNNTATAAPQSGDHWHAALGVYLCDHWDGDGDWAWPTQTADGAPGRAGSGLYAGLHSHGDGLIHIEPQTSDEMGKHATVGTYFKFGGWKLSDKEISFVGETKQAGDKCGTKPGEVRYMVNHVEKKGNPADYKIEDGDVIVIAFVPADFDMKKIQDPPSVKNLTNPNANEGQLGATTTLPTSASSAPSGTTTPATSAPAGGTVTSAAP